MIEIVTIETPSLGDRTYLATDGIRALVIDPQRDIQRVLAVAAARDVAVTHVFETHIHNNYVSGGLALARRTGAAYHVNAADAVAFNRVGIGDGDAITVGPFMRVRVVATPGHTFTHLAYALEDAITGEVEAVFTGGSLLHGSTGRPDLLGTEHTPHARRRAARLGLAAGPGPAGPDRGMSDARVRQLLRRHRVRRGRSYHRGREAVQPGADPRGRRLRRCPGGGPGRLPGLLRAHGRGQRGRAGWPLTRLRLPGWRRVSWPADRRRAMGGGPAPPAGVRGRARAGLAQLRVRGQLRHLPRLADPLGHPADPDRRDRRADRRRAARPGPDRDRPPGGRRDRCSGGWPATSRLAAYPVSDYPGLAAAWDRQDLAVVDVRRASERARGLIAGSLHEPLHELPGRLGDLPQRPLWVHCQGGYRASIAASLLQAAGHTVTAIDDDFSRRRCGPARHRAVRTRDHCGRANRGFPMTLVEQQLPVLTWTEPAGIATRGTLVVIPGRGEQPAHYERFGRRIAADGYRVHAVTDPTADPAFAASQVSAQLAEPDMPGPRVLAGPTPARYGGCPGGGSGQHHLAAGTTCSTTSPTGPWPPPSCCSSSGCGWAANSRPSRCPRRWTAFPTRSDPVEPIGPGRAVRGPGNILGKALTSPPSDR